MPIVNTHHKKPFLNVPSRLIVPTTFDIPLGKGVANGTWEAIILDKTHNNGQRVRPLIVRLG